MYCLSYIQIYSDVFPMFLRCFSRFTPMFLLIYSDASPDLLRCFSDVSPMLICSSIEKHSEKDSPGTYRHKLQTSAQEVHSFQPRQKLLFGNRMFIFPNTENRFRIIFYVSFHHFTCFKILRLTAAVKYALFKFFLLYSR